MKIKKLSIFLFTLGFNLFGVSSSDINKKFIGVTTCKSSIILIDQEDVEYVKDCTKILGNLMVSIDKSDLKLSLPNLKEVIGHVLINDNSKITEVNLNSLEIIEKELHIQNNPNLKTIQIGSLRKVQEVWIGKVPAEISLRNEGIEIRKYFYIVETEIKNIDLVLLNNIQGYIKIEKNKNLSHLELKALNNYKSDLSIKDNPKLASIHIPDLTKIIGYITIEENKNLKIVTIPKLIKSTKLIIKNENLLDVDLGHYKLGIYDKVESKIKCEENKHKYSHIIKENCENPPKHTNFGLSNGHSLNIILFGAFLAISLN